MEILNLHYLTFKYKTHLKTISFENSILIYMISQEFLTTFQESKIQIFFEEKSDRCLNNIDIIIEF